MRTIIRISLIIALTLIFSQKSEANSYKFEAKRTITKECSVNKNMITAVLKFANIKFEAWDKNEISMVAELKGMANSQKTADEVLKNIDVKLYPNGNDGTKIETVINHDAINAMQKRYGNKNIGYKIDIIVKMPKGLYMTINNKYGNATVEQELNSLNSDIKYGNLKASNINGDATIVSKYGNTTLGNVKGKLNIDQKYGDLKAGNLADIEINCKYGKVTIGNAKAVTGYLGYVDNMKIGNVESLKMSEIGYSNCSIGMIENKVVVNNLKYGDIKINVGSKFKEVDIKSSYSGVVVGIDGNSSFDYALSSSYGSINFDGITTTNRLTNNSSNSTSMMGTAGSGTPNAKVTISNRYANIKIKKN